MTRCFVFALLLFSAPAQAGQAALVYDADTLTLRRVILLGDEDNILAHRLNAGECVVLAKPAAIMLPNGYPDLERARAVILVERGAAP